jgi:hypothetical protein
VSEDTEVSASFDLRFVNPEVQQPLTTTMSSRPPQLFKSSDHTRIGFDSRTKVHRYQFEQSVLDDQVTIEYRLTVIGDLHLSVKNLGGSETNVHQVT